MQDYNNEDILEGLDELQLKAMAQNLIAIANHKQMLITQQQQIINELLENLEKATTLVETVVNTIDSVVEENN